MIFAFFQFLFYNIKWFEVLRKLALLIKNHLKAINHHHLHHGHHHWSKTQSDHVSLRHPQLSVNRYSRSIHSIDILINTRLTSRSILSRHLMDSWSTFGWSTVGWVSIDSYIDHLSTEMLMECQLSVNRGVNWVSIECWSRVDQGYQSALNQVCN